MYADESYYKLAYKGVTLSADDITYALNKASRHIDVLTYNRIVGKGFENLTDYQKKVVQEVCCQLADFEVENADIIETTLQNYSINGVSMSFGNSWNVKVENGVAISREIYSYLATTGLCCKVLR